MTVDDLTDGLILRIKSFFDLLQEKTTVESGFKYYDFDDCASVYVQIGERVYFILYDFNDSKIYLLEEVHHFSNSYYEPDTYDLVDIIESDDLHTTLEYILTKKKLDDAYNKLLSGSDD